MYQKGNLFYADFKGEDGKRKRKSFPTELAAKRYENRMRAANPSQGETSPVVSPISPRGKGQPPTVVTSPVASLRRSGRRSHKP